MLHARKVITLALLSVATIIPITAHASTSLTQVFSEIELQYRLPVNILAKIAQAESGGNPTVCNSINACGMFQWLPNSWVWITAAMYKQPLMLESRKDPVTSAKVTAYSLALTRDRNGSLIQQAKIDLSLGLYMGHFLGQAGSHKFLTAYIQNPSANATSIFPKEAQYNPTIFGSRSLADVLNLMARKIAVPGVINVPGNYSDALGISYARSDADVGLNEFYPPGFVPSGYDPSRTYVTDYNSGAGQNYQPVLNQWTSPSVNPITGSTTTPPIVSPIRASPIAGSTVSESGSQAVSHSAGVILSQADSISRGGIALIAWSSVGMKPDSCVVTRNGLAFSTSNEGSKTLSADMTSVAGVTTLVLRCVSMGGENTTASIDVTIR